MNAVLHLLRKMLRLSAPKIDRGQAIEIALAELGRRGGNLLHTRALPARQPVAREGLKCWTVLLDPDFRPCRVVVIDNQTGAVINYVSPSR